jgi:hypothetical protein
MALPNKFDIDEFDKLLSNYLAKLEKEFRKGIKLHTKPFLLIEDFNNQIRNRLTKLHNKNHYETTAFLRAQDLRVKLGIKTFGQAFKKYYSKIKTSLPINIDVLAQIVSLYTFRDINIPTIKNEFGKKPTIPEMTQADLPKTIVFKKDISVKEDYIDIIVKILDNYIPEESKEDLITALNGKPIKNKILFQSNGNKLTDLFWCLTRPGLQAIVDSKTQIVAWICKTFRYLDVKSNPQDFVKTDVQKSVSTATRRCKKPMEEINKFLGSIS